MTAEGLLQSGAAKWIDRARHLCTQKNTMTRYKQFSQFLNDYFSCKVQKLSVNAGLTCPNRDGTLGFGGCTYCNNHSFNPQYCADARSVSQQLDEGKAFFSRKYKDMKYLAYFQAYTNTYAGIDRLRQLYEEALSVADVEGLVVGTRPDCVPDDLLDYLSEIHRRKFVLVEYGVETANDAVLRRVHRGHDFACAADAIQRTAARGLPVGAHLILGLPGDDHEDIMKTAAAMSRLPLNVLKLHQLQLVKGTLMAAEFRERPEDFTLFTAEAYADLVVDFLERLRPDIAVERFTSQSPAELLIAPDWGLKNYQFVELVKRRMAVRDTWQGRLYEA